MDAQARKKALFRAKLNAQKKEKRIESPLVRVCDVILKSESNWDAHQASRKHHEAISKLKANAAGLTRPTNSKTVTHTELPESKPEYSEELHTKMPEQSKHKSQTSSMLPPDFFDNSEAKRKQPGKDPVQSAESDSLRRTGSSTQTKVLKSLNLEDDLPSSSITESVITQATMDVTQTSTPITGSEMKQVKGALPEGFFDNKEADLRARGIKLVKPDVKDEYKEFEKLIQEDLKEVDDRLEEEEVDAAETIEEAESIEQKTYREKVEMLRKKRMEQKAARPTKRSKSSEAVREEPRHKESSSDDDSDENFAVDWRAQHL
ncbi:Zinc finger protein [Quillaja saponaria]|uniref:Zinc finger protein n=1 Tax=Quillaja saponaria TaxID=32244 RepID=A0AAD7PQQ7_QUISA|nr:Zinc finger protein [Quillaja saponaria]